MSIRLVNSFLEAKNIPRKYKHALVLLPLMRTMTGRMFLRPRSRWRVRRRSAGGTMYERISQLEQFGVIKEVTFHTCKSPKCKGGTLHSTPAHGH